MAQTMTDAKTSALNPQPRFPPLALRRPVWLWLPIAYALSAGWPVVALAGLGVMTSALAANVAVTAALALLTALILREAARPLRTRRDVVLLFLIYGAAGAGIAPTIIGYATGAVGAAGFDASTAASLWPLALMTGLPVALLAGLVFSGVACVKPPAREPDKVPMEASPPQEASHER